MTNAADPAVIDRVQRDIREMYGSRVTRIMLYGSRARGDAQEDSDYDLAVFLAPLEDRWAELDRLAIKTVEWFDLTGALVDARAYRAEAFDERTPLMREIRLDGVAV